MSILTKIPKQYNPENFELELYRALIQLSKLVKQINEYAHHPDVISIHARKTDFGQINYGYNCIFLDLDRCHYITIGNPSSGFALWYGRGFMDSLQLSIPLSLKKGDKFNRVICNKVSELIEEYPQLPYKIFRMGTEVEIMFNDIKDYLNNKQSEIE